MHHAFTSPKPESLETFDTDPGSALAYAYDLVCNGNEIGGGSIRIHRRDIQERVFAVMGLSAEEAQAKFGFLLDAFAFGAPPHGGIAFGWDRICALLSGTDSIREVIAFPKSGGGVDPLTDAPAPITAAQRKEAGVDAKPRPDRAQPAAAAAHAGGCSRAPIAFGSTTQSAAGDDPLGPGEGAHRAGHQVAGGAQRGQPVGGSRGARTDEHGERERDGDGGQRGRPAGGSAARRHSPPRRG